MEESYFEQIPFPSTIYFLLNWNKESLVHVCLISYWISSFFRITKAHKSQTKPNKRWNLLCSRTLPKQILRCEIFGNNFASVLIVVRKTIRSIRNRYDDRTFAIFIHFGNSPLFFYQSGIVNGIRIVAACSIFFSFAIAVSPTIRLDYIYDSTARITNFGSHMRNALPQMGWRAWCDSVCVCERACLAVHVCASHNIATDFIDFAIHAVHVVDSIREFYLSNCV